MIGTYNAKALSLTAGLLLAGAGATTGFQLRTPQPQKPLQHRSVNMQTFDGLLAGDVRIANTALSAASAADEDRVLDTEAIAKYGGAIAARKIKPCLVIVEAMDKQLNLA